MPMLSWKSLSPKDSRQEPSGRGGPKAAPQGRGSGPGAQPRSRNPSGIQPLFLFLEKAARVFSAIRVDLGVAKKRRKKEEDEEGGFFL